MRLIIFILSAYSAFAAFASTTEWEVRTTGNAANGGGFNTSASGTDYSQQDSPQCTYTDLVIGGTTTQATSAACPFDSTSPGNIANIISGSGCTVQRAQVVSVAGSTATFDKALGTAGSTCSGRLGGALLTIAAPVSLAVSQNTIHIKSGTYTVTSAIDNGTGGIWLSFIGYQNTHRDGGTKPVVTTATNLVNLFQLGSSKNRMVNMKFTNTAAGTRYAAISLQNTDSSVEIVDCISDGPAQLLFSSTSFRPSFIINSEATNGAQAVKVGGGNVFVIGSYFHDNSAAAIESTSSDQALVTAYVAQSIIVGNATGIIGTANSTVAVVNSIIANHSGNGITVTSPINVTLINSIIYGNGGYGVSCSAAPNVHAQLYTAFGSNTSGNRQNLPTDSSDITLTADPFTNSAGEDYSLNSTAGGGALLKNLGFPGVFQGSATTGYNSVGPVIPSSAASAATLAYPFVQ